ncbi:MATE family efflux transporter [Clostridiaceae bacterium]|nr:MATE family efflux transporter [Clostridiaceae bacterium]RKI12031.1 MATE family efflux transporter [bacterium 1XD21-70]
MRRHIDLLHGGILGSLTGLALPIMATSLVQTAYNLTDMAWIGRVGSSAVAAVGAAGMYTWLSTGIVTLARMGGQVKVAHSLGKKEAGEAVEYGRGALQLTVVLAFIFALAANLFTGNMIGFFGLSSGKIVADAGIYLRITCGLILFSFLNQTMTGLFTAIGDSKTPFLANCTGLAVNMVLDPLLIFGPGPFPRMEAAGAAAATVTAQMVVTFVLVQRASQDTVLFNKIDLRCRTAGRYFREILRLGVPSALQSMLYSSISMVLTRMIASWGDAAVAVQRVGGQVECISWMTAEGFGSAMNAFTGQNYGARLYERVRKGYGMALAVVGLWGTFTSLVLIFGAEPIFRIFIQEEQVVPIGISYLVVLGIGQMPMCEELLTVGALQGLGRTLSCSVITIVLTAARIPLALFLTGTGLGLNGIWWALTITSIAKGLVFVLYYLWVLKRLPGKAAAGQGAGR